VVPQVFFQFDESNRAAIAESNATANHLWPRGRGENDVHVMLGTDKTLPRRRGNELPPKGISRDDSKGSDCNVGMAKAPRGACDRDRKANGLVIVLRNKQSKTVPSDTHSKGFGIARDLMSDAAIAHTNM